jgi:glycerol uptake facilitator-like aquaporin
MFFYVGGWAVINTTITSNFDDCSCALAHMITLGLMIWSGSFVSGGHFNPAVTTCFIVFKRIHWLKGLFYILAQLLGGLFAAALLKVIVSNDSTDLTLNKSVNGFPILGKDFWWKQCIIEFIGTFFLMTVVYMTAVDSRASSDPVHGMAIGGVVGFMLLASPPGAASAFNPARAFCPMLIDCTNGQFKWVWIWIVFPIAGAIVAGLMCEWFLNDVGEESTAGAVKLEVIMDGELDLGADMTTPMRETGDIRVEAEVEVDNGKFLLFLIDKLSANLSGVGFGELVI